MPDEVRLWRVGPDEQLTEIRSASLNLESRRQEWLVHDISILDPALMVIGREVPTDFSGPIDILCVNVEADLVIVELKRDRTPREVTAQALDYASWVVTLSNEQVTSIADDYLAGDGFEAAFTTKFGIDLPETLNGRHRILVVGSEIDASSRAHHQVPLRRARCEHQCGDVPVFPAATRLRTPGPRLSHPALRGGAED